MERPTTYSAAINAVIALAEAEGNRIAEISTGWEKVRQVVHMVRPMSQGLREQGGTQAELRFWSTDATPHYRATCGFIDETQKVAIEFPRHSS